MSTSSGSRSRRRLPNNRRCRPVAIPPDRTHACGTGQRGEPESSRYACCSLHRTRSDPNMAEHHEVRHEKLWLKEPGTERLRKNATARLRYLLNTGWRETDRWIGTDYITVKVERSGDDPIDAELVERLGDQRLRALGGVTLPPRRALQAIAHLEVERRFVLGPEVEPSEPLARCLVLGDPEPVAVPAPVVGQPRRQRLVPDRLWTLDAAE